MTKRKHHKIKFRSFGIILCRVEITNNITLNGHVQSLSLHSYTAAIGFTRARKRRHIIIFILHIHSHTYRPTNTNTHFDGIDNGGSLQHTVHSTIIVCITRRQAHTDICTIASAYIHKHKLHTNK